MPIRSMVGYKVVAESGLFHCDKPIIKQIIILMPSVPPIAILACLRCPDTPLLKATPVFTCFGLVKPKVCK
jgi:hypothetical protein